MASSGEARFIVLSDLATIIGNVKLNRKCGQEITPAALEKLTELARRYIEDYERALGEGSQSLLDPARPLPDVKLALIKLVVLGRFLHANDAPLIWRRFWPRPGSLALAPLPQFNIRPMPKAGLVEALLLEGETPFRKVPISVFMKLRTVQDLPYNRPRWQDMFHRPPHDQHALAYVQDNFGRDPEHPAGLGLTKYAPWPGDALSVIQRLAGYRRHWNRTDQKWVVEERRLGPHKTSVQLEWQRLMGVRKGTLKAPSRIRDLDTIWFNPNSVVLPDNIKFGAALPADPRADPPPPPVPMAVETLEEVIAHWDNLAIAGDIDPPPEHCLAVLTTKCELHEWSDPDKMESEVRVIFNQHKLPKYTMVVATQLYERSLSKVIEQRVAEGKFHPVGLGLSWTVQDGVDGAVRFLERLLMGRALGEVDFYCPDIKRMDQSIPRGAHMRHNTYLRACFDDGNLGFSRAITYSAKCSDQSVITVDGYTLTFRLLTGLVSGKPGTTLFDLQETDSCMIDFSMEKGWWDPSRMEARVGDATAAEWNPETGRNVVLTWISFGDDLVICASKKAGDISEPLAAQFLRRGYTLKPETLGVRDLDGIQFLGCSFFWDQAYDEWNGGVDLQSQPKYGWPLFDTERLWASLVRPTKNPPTGPEMRLWLKARYIGLAVVGGMDAEFYTACRTLFHTMPVKPGDDQWLAKIKTNDLFPVGFEGLAEQFMLSGEFPSRERIWALYTTCPYRGPPTPTTDKPIPASLNWADTMEREEALQTALNSILNDDW